MPLTNRLIFLILLNTAEEKLFTVTEGTLRKSYDKNEFTLIKGALTEY